MLIHKIGAQGAGRLALSTACAAVLLALGACGGGGSDNSSSVATGTKDTVRFDGVVVDGPIEGAVVFLDLNNNLAHDSGEPVSAPTDASGSFTLESPPLTGDQLATAMLVANVPPTAKDADDLGATLQEAGKKGFTLMSPVGAYLQADGSDQGVSHVVVSPLTTLVAGEMSFNGQTLAEARASVKAQLGFENRDPMADFVAIGDRALGSVARVTAIALGETGERAADLAQEEGAMAERDRLAVTMQAVKSQLPSLANAFELSAGATPTVETVVAELSKEEAVAAFEKASAGEKRVAPHGFQRLIVVFRSDVDSVAESGAAMRGVNGRVDFVYGTAVKGFAVTLPDPAVDAFLAAMQRNPNVDYVEIDKPVTANALVQTGATWGLDRTDQRDLPLSGTFSYGASGAGVTAYVFDTGIRATHVDFGKRVAPGYTAINDGRGTNDCNGHGTHVAGTIGGSTWGMAKDVTLVPVRVLDCSAWGSYSGMIAGIDWVLANHEGRAVINMSLGGSGSLTLDSAVARAVSRGVPVVVAAMNNSASACNYSPARAPAAITVAATTSSDARATYSNYGTCVDFFAPGHSIRSAWYSSDTATQLMAGTSMASPHVAGLAALLLESRPTASATEIADAIKASATAGKVKSAGSGSPNLLIYADAASMKGTPPGTTTPPPPEEPTPPPPQEPIPPPPEETTAPTPSNSVFIASLAGSSTAAKNQWSATVTIGVKDTNGAWVPGAVVKGGFSIGGSSVTCKTGSNGLCSVKSGTIHRRDSTTTYSVSSVSATGLNYASSENASSSIVVRQP